MSVLDSWSSIFFKLARVLALCKLRADYLLQSSSERSREL